MAGWFVPKEGREVLTGGEDGGAQRRKQRCSVKRTTNERWSTDENLVNDQSWASYYLVNEPQKKGYFGAKDQ